jgi:formylglycine-generating enzyme required for sulfatase activity
MARKKVYVSSTFKDLEEHRKAVKATMERAGFDVECMEQYPAFDERPKDKCLADVADCDYYVLVLAWRYGFRPEDDNPGGLSITHLEYEEAIRRGKPCLAFLLDPDADWKRGFLDPDSLSPDSPICRFRDHVEKRHGRRLFTTPDRLAAAVLEPLRAEEQKHLSQAERDRLQVRDDYLAWLRATCESVELLGLTLKESQNVRLGQVYVPAVTARAAAESPDKNQEQSHALLLERLGEDSLYIPGAPGSGKTTFCRWLAYLAAGGPNPGHAIPAPEEFRETLPAALAGRFPVLCRLREWSGRAEGLSGNGSWTRAQLEDSLAGWLDATRPGGLSGAVFREELAAGRCLLILDGVDEIPETLPGGHRPRRNFVTGLADARPGWLKRGNRVLLTSRPYGLCDDDRRRLRLTGAELAELPEALQETFVRRWYAAADPPKAREKAEGLLHHLAERPDLRELRQNPMLLTALCVLYDQGQRLPQDFYQLYDALVGQVLYKRYLDPNEQYRARVRLEAVALGMHRGIAEDRTTPEPEADNDEIDRHLAALSRSDVVTEGGAAAAAERREDLLSNSGLLLPKAGGRAGFYHLSFQEFLAAGRLRRIGEKTEAILRRYAATPAWHRTLRFLFCALADKDSPEAAMEGFESLSAHLEPAQLDRDPNPALLLCDCLEVAHGRGWNLERHAEPLRRACRHALEHLEPPPRAHLWRTLGRLGLDDRPGVGIRDGLPDSDWVEVPAGPFRYGVEQEIRTLPAFRIARHPVTNAQFQAFIDDGGYAAEAWWKGLAERPEPMRGKWSEPNHPRETVSWYEAMAYARWLDARLRERGLLPDGWTVRLPTEEEWEKAAGGGDRREFPWGNCWQAGRANINETWDRAGPNDLGRTSAVGLYPAGASPRGALDMAGNVWEWCLNESDNPERLASNGNAWREVRGGSWDDDRDLARCAHRVWSRPDGRGSDVGFRVVCGSPLA